GPVVERGRDHIAPGEELLLVVHGLLVVVPGEHPVGDLGRKATGDTGGVGRCFRTTVRKGVFSWDFDEKVRRYDEELLCGHYVITTSLDKDEVPAAQVVRYYRSLQNVEHRFRVLKDFLDLRPIFHWTEDRVRGHVALCVMAATIEAVMAKDLVNAKVMDPDLPLQPM